MPMRPHASAGTIWRALTRRADYSSRPLFRGGERNPPCPGGVGGLRRPISRRREIGA
jgi:hypothetical protein